MSTSETLQHPRLLRRQRYARRQSASVLRVLHVRWPVIPRADVHVAAGPPPKRSPLPDTMSLARYVRHREPLHR